MEGRDLAQHYAELVSQRKKGYTRVQQEESAQEKPKSGVETTKTVVMYMLNLVCMVLMCVLIVGVLVISGIVYLEGSLAVDPMLFAHLAVPACVLALNLYVILLEDHEEERFFKSSRRSNSEQSTGKGVVLVNLALVGSVVSLGVAAYFKFVLGSGQQQGDTVLYDEDYDDSAGGPVVEKVIFIEECLLHALAVLESMSLREYAKSKLRDLLAARKKK